RQKYESMAAAAKALRVSTSAISMAKKRGYLHRVAAPFLQDKNHNGTKCPILVRGVKYPSIRRAAQALKVSHSTIVRSLDKGTIDEVGIEKPHPQAIPCKYNGKEYKSIRAAIRQVIKDHGSMFSQQALKYIEIDRGEPE